MEDDVLQMVQSSPAAGSRKITHGLATRQTTAWRTAHEFGLYPLLIQNVQAQQQNDYFGQEEFCHRFLRNQILCTNISFRNEAFSTKME
jgi:hypothetical protein